MVNSIVKYMLQFVVDRLTVIFHCVRAQGAIQEEAAGCRGTREDVSHTDV